LQTYFNQRVLPIVRKHGKKMMGWDEILHQDLPKDIMVESWQNHESLAIAARRGYKGLLSFGYYLDHLKSAGAYYSVDPTGGPAKTLTGEQAKNILGGEACMWTEFISAETIDSRMWPKSAAVAERLWSPAAYTDVADMYRRLDIVTHRLDHYGARHNLNYEPMLRRIAPAAPIDALRTLADTLDPLGIEHRRCSRPTHRTRRSTAWWTPPAATARPCANWKLWFGTGSVPASSESRVRDPPHADDVARQSRPAFAPL